MVFLVWVSIVAALIAVGLVIRVVIRVDHAHRSEERARAFRRSLKAE